MMTKSLDLKQLRLNTGLRRKELARVSHRAYILEEMDIRQIAAHIIVTNTVSALTRERAVLSSTVVTACAAPEAFLI